MAVSSTTGKVQIGSGSTLNITPLGAGAKTHVKVVRLESDDSETILVLDSDFTINDDLTTVTLTTAIDGTTYKRASAVLDIPITQEVDWRDIGDFDTSTAEIAADNRVRMMKVINEKLDRTISAPISTSSVNFDLSLTGNAGKYLKVNPAENGFAFDDITSISFWNGFTLPAADGTADQVLTTNGSGTLSWTTLTNDDPSGMNIEAYLLYNQATDTIINSYNIASVSDDATGEFTINFTTAITDSNYGILGTCRSDGTTASYVTAEAGGTKTTSAIELVTLKNLTKYDSTEISVLIYT